MTKLKPDDKSKKTCGNCAYWRGGKRPPYLGICGKRTTAYHTFITSRDHYRRCSVKEIKT